MYSWLPYPLVLAFWYSDQNPLSCFWFSSQRGAIMIECHGLRQHWFWKGRLITSGAFLAMDLLPSQYFPSRDGGVFVCAWSAILFTIVAQFCLHMDRQQQRSLIRALCRGYHSLYNNWAVKGSPLLVFLYLQQCCKWYMYKWLQQEVDISWGVENAFLYNVDLLSQQMSIGTGGLMAPAGAPCFNEAGFTNGRHLPANKLERAVWHHVVAVMSTLF